MNTRYLVLPVILIAAVFAGYVFFKTFSGMGKKQDAGVEAPDVRPIPPVADVDVLPARD